MCKIGRFVYVFFMTDTSKKACLFINSIKLVCQCIQCYSEIHSTHLFSFSSYLWIGHDYYTGAVMTILSSSSDFSAYEASKKILLTDSKTDLNLKNK